MKKNKVFVNKIEKKIDNNQNSCYVNDIVDNNDNIGDTMRKKIDNLFDRNGYIFNVDVNIITHDKNYRTRIAGIVNNNIITMDHNIININDIKDIVIN